jgi:hypothetical protein
LSQRQRNRGRWVVSPRLGACWRHKRQSVATFPIVSPAMAAGRLDDGQPWVSMPILCCFFATSTGSHKPFGTQPGNPDRSAYELEDAPACPGSQANMAREVGKPRRTIGCTVCGCQEHTVGDVAGDRIEWPASIGTYNPDCRTTSRRGFASGEHQPAAST